MPEVSNEFRRQRRTPSREPGFPVCALVDSRDAPLKLARFIAPTGQSCFGVIVEDVAVSLGHRVASFAALLEDPLAGTPMVADPRWPLRDVVLSSPIGPLAKVLCVGLNFVTHAAESGRDVPTRPVLFSRFPDSFVDPGQPVVRPFDNDSLDWEGEVALVIGRGGRRIPVDEALEHIAGFACMAENSVRDWQQHSAQVTAGKNWFASGICGPWVVSRDEVGDAPLQLRTLLNGDVVQEGSTDHLRFGFAELIAYISTFTPLRPGDVIATGTPSGVGVRRDPPRFLHPGDELTVEISRVGRLTHAVIDEQQLLESARQPRVTLSQPLSQPIRSTKEPS
jgi:2-keto-4-pentenoate hydratase/2-oxohepta-3-ene-1,7-dioic acid hydratase in catechol pathway